MESSRAVDIHDKREKEIDGEKMCMAVYHQSNKSTRSVERVRIMR